jgi:4-hydroxyacetophenone monooxygenase
MDDFAGRSFQSARWPEDLDLPGARFALVGAGAGGFQIAPTIAEEVEQLTIYQRTAQ